MDMQRLFLGMLVSLALAATPAVADTPAGMTEISVAGNGQVALAPDVANVGANVETNAPNASDAVGQNNARYDRIVAALEKAGVARSDITLSSYNVNYNPKPRVIPPTPGGERYGYTVSREFNVKVRDIGKAGRVADACTSSGATSINGVTFGLADPSVPRAEASRKAVDDARTNAETLASAAHLHIVSIKSMELGGGAVNPQPMMRMAVANAPTQFDQSNVNVSVSVTVTFLAQP
jgi:uncharacterized protein YggE